MNQISMFESTNNNSPSEQFYYYVVDTLKKSNRTEVTLKLKSLKSYDAIDFVGLGDSTPEIRIKFGKKNFFSVKVRHKNWLKEHQISYTADNTKLWLNIAIELPSDALKFSALFQKLYDDYLSKTSSDSFDCCSLYMQCSDAKKCIHTIPAVKNFCKYRIKLANGVIFYGKNRNV